MLELFQYLDPLLKGMSTAMGVGLIGLMLVRSDARGRFKVVGLEAGPLFAPSMKQTGRWLGYGFIACVGLMILRTFGAVV
jgi:hypothetical protein